MFPLRAQSQFASSNFPYEGKKFKPEPDFHIVKLKQTKGTISCLHFQHKSLPFNMFFCESMNGCGERNRVLSSVLVCLCAVYLRESSGKPLWQKLFLKLQFIGTILKGTNQNKSVSLSINEFRSIAETTPTKWDSYCEKFCSASCVVASSHFLLLSEELHMFVINRRGRGGNSPFPRQQTKLHSETRAIQSHALNSHQQHFLYCSLNWSAVTWWWCQSVQTVTTLFKMSVMQRIWKSITMEKSSA